MEMKATQHKGDNDFFFSGKSGIIYSVLYKKDCTFLACNFSVLSLC